MMMTSIVQNDTTLFLHSVCVVISSQNCQSSLLKEKKKSEKDKFLSLLSFKRRSRFEFMIQNLRHLLSSIFVSFHFGLSLARLLPVVLHIVSFCLCRRQLILPSIAISTPRRAVFVYMQNKNNDDETILDPIFNVIPSADTNLIRDCVISNFLAWLLLVLRCTRMN